jgi:hypothetical protein
MVPSALFRYHSSNQSIPPDNLARASRGWPRPRNEIYLSHPIEDVAD